MTFRVARQRRRAGRTTTSFVKQPQGGERREAAGAT